MTNRYIAGPGAFLGCLLALSPLPAADVREDEKGTYLGALFMSRAQPASTGTAPVKAAPGAVVTFVLPGSPAARADLRRNDVLLGYDRKAIRDGDHLAALIRNDKPGRLVRLLVLRGKTKVEVEVKLALGTALRPAERDEGRGKANTRAQAQVSVWATPLHTGQLNLTVEYYTAEGNLKRVTCDGPAGLKTELSKLPERERHLVHIALQRLKSYSAVKEGAGPEKAKKGGPVTRPGSP